MITSEIESAAIALLKRTDYCHAEIVALDDAYCVVAVWPDDTRLVDTFTSFRTARICEVEINRQISALGWKSGRED